ncbi:MAG TPA: ATP-binding cassette domain-containing protein, partial [Phenylobacterium sp.]
MASAKPPGTAGALEASDLRSRLIGPFSFTWPLGECVAIEGESGAGKSLFLRLLADLDPNQGVVRLCGAVRNEMTATAWRRLAPYVPAEPGWWDDQVEAHFAVED